MCSNFSSSAFAVGRKLLSIFCTALWTWYHHVYMSHMFPLYYYLAIALKFQCQSLIICSNFIVSQHDIYIILHCNIYIYIFKYYPCLNIEHNYSWFNHEPEPMTYTYDPRLTENILQHERCIKLFDYYYYCHFYKCVLLWDMDTTNKKEKRSNLLLHLLLYISADITLMAPHNCQSPM